MFDFQELKDRKLIVQKIIESYQNHPDVVEIRKDFPMILKVSFSTNEHFRCLKKLLGQINIKKAIGVDTVHSKLRKLSAGSLVKSLILTINCSSQQGVFPGKTQIATVALLDTGKSNKNDILNYRHVSIFNKFFKEYENKIKEQLVSDNACLQKRI